MSEDKKYLVSVHIEATVALEVKAESLYYARKKAEELVEERMELNAIEDNFSRSSKFFSKDLKATLMRDVYFARGGELIEDD